MSDAIRSNGHGAVWVPRVVNAAGGVCVAAIVLATGILAAERWQKASAQAESAQSAPVARQPVRVVAARQAAVQAWAFAEGTARSVQREYLTFELSGRVTFVGPEKSGVPVKKGEVLAQLDKRKYVADVEAAQAELEEARTKASASQADINQAQTQFNLTNSEFNRTRQLFEKSAVSQSQLDEAEAKAANARAAIQSAQAQAHAVEAGITAALARLRQVEIALEEAEIVSPIDGIVAYLNIEEGYYVTQSLIRTTSEAEALQTVPIVVIDPGRYEITVDVPAYDAGRIQVGQPVLILPGGSSEAAVVRVVEGNGVSSAANGQTWFARGVVFSVNPAVNPGGRSVQVKVRTTEGAENLRDGMFVTTWIATEQKPDAVVAPFDAFLYEENLPYVFVVEPETGSVERRSVELGIQGLTRREIRSGVEPDEQLVTDGRYRLVDGAPVKVLEYRQPSQAISDDQQPDIRR